MEGDIEFVLNTYGICVTEIRPLSAGHENAFVINGHITGRRGQLLIHLAVIGEERRIEEDIAILIKLELNTRNGCSD